MRLRPSRRNRRAAEARADSPDEQTDSPRFRGSASRSRDEARRPSPSDPRRSRSPIAPAERATRRSRGPQRRGRSEDREGSPGDGCRPPAAHPSQPRGGLASSQPRPEEAPRWEPPRRQSSTGSRETRRRKDRRATKRRFRHQTEIPDPAAPLPANGDREKEPRAHLRAKAGRSRAARSSRRPLLQHPSVAGPDRSEARIPKIHPPGGNVPRAVQVLRQRASFGVERGENGSVGHQVTRAKIRIGGAISGARHARRDEDGLAGTGSPPDFR